MVEKKLDVDFKRHDKDTGSPEYQIALLSAEIKLLQEHLSLHKKDFDAKRSILKKVAKRRTLLKYLKEKNLDTYVSVSKKFGIK